MNPGPVEESAKVAGGIVEALKAQPLSLALVVMNLALLGLLYYIGEKTSATREREVNLLYENQQHIAEVLSHCIVPPSGPKLQSDESKPFVLPADPTKDR